MGIWLYYPWGNYRPLGLSATRIDVCSIAAVEPNVPRSTQVLYNFLYNYVTELTRWSFTPRHKSMAHWLFYFSLCESTSIVSRHPQTVVNRTIFWTQIDDFPLERWRVTWAKRRQNEIHQFSPGKRKTRWLNTKHPRFLLEPANWQNMLARSSFGLKVLYTQRLITQTA